MIPAISGGILRCVSLSKAADATRQLRAPARAAPLLPPARHNPRNAKRARQAASATWRAVCRGNRPDPFSGRIPAYAVRLFLLVAPSDRRLGRQGPPVAGDRRAAHARRA